MAVGEKDFTLASATEAIDDLIGILQELRYKLENVDDLSNYGLLESLVSSIEETLERYNALE